MTSLIIFQNHLEVTRDVRKQINKGTSNQLTERAQEFKTDFINGNDTAGCLKVFDLEAFISSQNENKIDPDAKDSLLNDATGSTQAVKDAKGCVPAP